jgi:hypothetical protein
MCNELMNIACECRPLHAIVLIVYVKNRLRFVALKEFISTFHSTG